MNGTYLKTISNSSPQVVLQNEEVENTSATASVVLVAMVMPTAGWIIQRIILPIICACGIMGIILTLIVLSRKNMCTSTNCYLMALATTDLLFLIILSTNLADNQFEQYSKRFYHFVIYVTFSAIFVQIFLFASVWLTVLLAVERFIGICKPFLAGRICTVTKARFFIVVIYVLAIACRLPNFWENHIKTVNDTSRNDSITYIVGSDLSSDYHYITFYPWIIDGVITSMLPFSLLVYLNIRLIWEVKRSTAYLQRNQMLQENGTTVIIEREELQVTIMLISVIIVFFICQGPYVVYTAIISINKYVVDSHHIMLFRYITILMLTMKSAVNFVLFCWFSEKFVTSLKGLCAVGRLFQSSKSCRKRNSDARRKSSLHSLTKDTVV